MSFYPEPRVLTRLWVQAQVRLCDIHAIPLAVVKSGDPERGAVLVRLLRGDGMSLLVRRQMQADGTTAWQATADGAAVDGETAEDYVARELGRDPDLWVIEVDDPAGRYWPDQPIDG